MRAHFDNSAANPSNPNVSPRDVGWGEQTTDEMCIGFLQLTRDDEHLGNEPPPRSARFANLEDRKVRANLERLRGLRSGIQRLIKPDE